VNEARLIDANALIDKIMLRHVDGAGLVDGSTVHYSANQVCEKIEQSPTVPAWVKVNSLMDLPPIGEWVIAKMRGGVCVCVITSTEKFICWETRTESCIDSDIPFTHWMPIPWLPESEE